jgi:Ca2+ transporting ATPase
LILVLNATIGVMQESNAEAAIEALKEYEAPHAKVVRNGEQQVIPAVDLVVGDIVQIAVGDLVPADLRLIELNSTTLRTDQSALTGESVSVLKTPDVVKVENIELQGKTNILFSGTVVTYGKGTGIVVTVGKDTEIGKINTLLQTKKQKEEERTPLQRNLDKFGANLSIAIGCICIVVWMINITHFTDPVHGSFFRGAIYYFKIAVALAVAAIPEGLVSVLTLTFASGTRKMAAKNAIMRSLPSVETLGCTSVICSDKTGTLTTNRMSVIKMVTVESENGSLNEYDVRDTQYEPKGEIKLNGEILEQPYKHCALLEMAKAASLSNDSNLTRNDSGIIEIVGEPTEAALRVMAEKIGVPNLENDTSLLKSKKYWEAKYPKICTLEFTRERKSMSAYCKGDYLFVKVS